MTTQQSNYQDPIQHQTQQYQLRQPQLNNQYPQRPSNDVTYQGQQ